MDTTKEYIEMCSAAKEIQKLVPRNHHGCAGGDKSFFGYSEKLNGMVWLPRQDQLQDMLGGYTSSIGILIKYINDPDFDLRYFSWEQAWLCIVMHEKYNKTWNGTEWT